MVTETVDTVITVQLVQHSVQLVQLTMRRNPKRICRSQKRKQTPPETENEAEVEAQAEMEVRTVNEEVAGPSQPSVVSVNQFNALWSDVNAVRAEVAMLSKKMDMLQEAYSRAQALAREAVIYNIQ